VEGFVKQDRALRTRALVLDAAAAEFAAHGFAGSNLQLVADRTGLSKGAVYAHFPTKAALAAEMVRQFDLIWYSLLLTGEKSPNPPLAVLEELLSDLIRRLQQDIRFIGGLRLVSEEAQARRKVPEQFEHLQQFMAALVARCQERAGSRTLHAALISQFLLALVLGLHETTTSDAPVEWLNGMGVVLAALCLSAEGPGGCPGTQEAAACQAAVDTRSLRAPPSGGLSSTRAGKAQPCCGCPAGRGARPPGE
jgi:AcrR family transcriptional regulator